MMTNATPIMQPSERGKQDVQAELAKTTSKKSSKKKSKNERVTTGRVEKRQSKSTGSEGGKGWNNRKKGEAALKIELKQTKERLRVLENEKLEALRRESEVLAGNRASPPSATWSAGFRAYGAQVLQGGSENGHAARTKSIEELRKQAVGPVRAQAQLPGIGIDLLTGSKCTPSSMLTKVISNCLLFSDLSKSMSLTALVTHVTSDTTQFNLDCRISS
jgi:hypothetical protein